MKEITLNNKLKNIPECLEELSAEQYERFLELSLLLNGGHITPREMRTMWLSELMSICSPYQRYYASDQVAELDSQLHEIDSFFKISQGASGEVVYEPVLNTGVNLLPEYKGWKGVGNMLSGLTYDKFVNCHNALKEINRLSDNKEYTNLEGVFNEIAHNLYANENPEADVPPILAYHSFLLFSSVWHLICSVPIPINGEAVPFTALFAKEQAGGRADDHDPMGWTGVSFEIASSGVFGCVKEVYKTEFWDVLLYLYKCKTDADRLKKEIS